MNEFLLSFIWEQAEGGKEGACSSSDQPGEVDELSGTSSSDHEDSMRVDDAEKMPQNEPQPKPVALKPSSSKVCIFHVIKCLK